MASKARAKIFPHLWYAKEAEEAARFYASIFPDSHVDAVTPLLSESPKAGDVKTVLGLMADDALFMVPGREPFGKEAFAAASAGMKGVRMEGRSEIRELRVLGDWAYLRNHCDEARSSAPVTGICALGSNSRPFTWLPNLSGERIAFELGTESGAGARLEIGGLEYIGK